jgi:hypothetical protein
MTLAKHLSNSLRLTEFPPVRVCPGHVAQEGAVQAGGAVERERRVGGERHATNLRHQHAIGGGRTSSSRRPDPEHL